MLIRPSDDLTPCTNYINDIIRLENENTIELSNAKMCSKMQTINVIIAQ